jgi:hypothetical protein
MTRVGETVHYVARGSLDYRFPSVCRAAVVAEVGAWVLAQETSEQLDSDGVRHRTLQQTWKDNAIALVALNPTGAFFNTICEYAIPVKVNDTAKLLLVGGTWHRLEDCTA